MADDETRERINRLYWDSDASVGEIADQVGVSRRALYDAIEPRPASRSCPECGGALGFRNRTAAEGGEAECADCGFTTALRVGAADTGQDLATDRGREPGFEEPEVEQEARAGPKTPVRRLPPPHGGAAMSAALLAGIAAGAVTAYLLRRR